LVDTLRGVIGEPSWNGLDEPYILDASGKEDLGGGVAVGITVILRNARVQFEARLGPTYVQCIVSGGNLVATTLLGASMSPVEPSDFTQVVISQSSSATIITTGGSALTVEEHDKLMEIEVGGQFA
jgi:hypothetical protein